jgi:hypothetical protein
MKLYKVEDTFGHTLGLYDGSVLRMLPLEVMDAGSDTARKMMILSVWDTLSDTPNTRVLVDEYEDVRPDKEELDIPWKMMVSAGPDQDGW